MALIFGYNVTDVVIEGAGCLACLGKPIVLSSFENLWGPSKKPWTSWQVSVQPKSLKVNYLKITFNSSLSTYLHTSCVQYDSETYVYIYIHTLLFAYILFYLCLSNRHDACMHRLVHVCWFIQTSFPCCKIANPHDPTTRFEAGLFWKVHKKDMELSMEMVDGGGHNLTKRKILCPTEGQLEIDLKYKFSNAVVFWCESKLFVVVFVLKNTLHEVDCVRLYNV